MKIVIIGSGLIGLTAAYFLRLRGHDVTVLERLEGPGQGASLANGGLLTPSMPEPWNAPGCWRPLLSSVCRSDSAIQLRLRAVPSLTSWGVTFLRNSAPKRYARNTLSNLTLALHSVQVLRKLRLQLLLEYGATGVGTLRIFRDPAALEHAQGYAARWTSHGLRFAPLDPAAVIALEPSLAPIAGELAGAIHYQDDEVGDAYRFCLALTKRATQTGVTFRFGSTATRLETRRGEVTAVRCESLQVPGDVFIVAAGCYSGPLLRRLQARIPVQPVKGYSATFDRDQHRSDLRVPVIDDDLHVGIVPLGGSLRVVGTAEFAGFDVKLNRQRLNLLFRVLKQVLPRTQFNADAATPWCGLRPVSADGVPIIGRTRFQNLYVSTGHGHLGWTMAAGSADILADIVDQVAPSIDPSPFDPTRFVS